LSRRNSIESIPVHVERVEQAAEQPQCAGQHPLGEEQLFLARRALVDVEAREDALLHQLAIQVDLAVARALELLEDDLVHARARVDERRRDDGERAALLDVARGAEEALRLVQRVRVDAAGEDLAARRDDGVVGAREARDRVEEDHHVALVLDEALGLLDHHLGDLHVARRRLVEGRADDLALHGALHVRHLFGPLVDEQHDEVGVGVVGRDRVGDLLEEHRLARARRRHDQAALPFADGAEHVDDARGVALLPVLAVELLVRVEGREVVEEDLVARDLGRSRLMLVDLEQREVRLALLRRADRAATMSPVRRLKRRTCEGET
jgi:hypothetical protein